MATDGLSLYAAICELQALKSARIDKVQQPDKDLLLLHLHGASCGRVRLMLNIHNENGRIQLTGQSFENPDAAPAFCMLLRKHLIGCRIERIEQPGMDRIALFRLSGKNELRDEVGYTLIVELMGRHGNVFLTDADGRILDCMRHFGPGEDALRVCLPNCRYEEPPKQDRLHPFEVSEQTLTDLCKGRAPRFWLGNALLGVSRLCAQEICSDDTPPSLIAQQCCSVLTALKNGDFLPSVIPGRGVLPFAPQNSAYLSFPTMQAAQEAFYRMRDEEAILTKRRTALRAVIDRALKRTEKKLETCTQQITNEETAERDRMYGELLIANLGTMRVTPTAAAVWDWYADPPVEITVPLDARLNVQQNAQRYFKRYRKAKTAHAYALSQIESLTAERTYLEGLSLSLEQCTTAEELNELRDELTAQGYRKPDETRRPKGQPSKSKPLCYRAPDGSLIRVGKNNRQNEQLLKSEPPDAIWMHAKDRAASHVYLETNSPSPETLALAAEIAALHSKSADSAQVPVDYTLHRHVKKPSGARPGYVNYFHQHTIYVTPDAEKLLALRVNETEGL